MKKINVSELLKDCPSGMELDCTMYDDVYFDYVDELNIIHCYIQHETHRASITLNQHGTPNSDIKSKCVIFPKGKTSWEGFVPPCQFKDGDVVYIKTKGYNHNEFIIIFKEIKNDHIHKHACFAYQVLYTCKNAVCHLVDVEIMRLASEEEKQKLFQAIKEHGYRWNLETKTLEKLPKFKVGDRIRQITSGRCYIIKNIEFDRYILNNNQFIRFTDEDIYELVPDKFDITTLKPFESRVLVRNDEGQYWIPAFWGCKRADGYTTTFGWCKYCIPFDGNEHLLETNKDCDEYFKTWK